MQKIVVAGSLAILMATVAYAAERGYNLIDPNLREAYSLADQAQNHIKSAQADAHGVDFGDHANKAFELFQKAKDELVEADKWNNAHHRR